jgi:hypothetical protein
MLSCLVRKIEATTKDHDIHLQLRSARERQKPLNLKSPDDSFSVNPLLPIFLTQIRQFMARALHFLVVSINIGAQQ